MKRPGIAKCGVPHEHDEQVDFVRWFELQFPDVRFFAIPNGGHRNVIVAAKLKREGVKKGVPDIYVPAWRLWIEMKRRKGSTTSKEQKEWRRYLLEIGDAHIIAKGCADARAQVLEFVKGGTNGKS